MIQFYNSLSRKKEVFEPSHGQTVGLYTCGPTVYNDQHVGNMRSYATWDVLKRFLISQGYAVTHIMNITDVGHLTSDADTGEDKMEVAKTRERMNAWDVAEHYFEAFKNDLKALNIQPPTKYVRATALIKEQIDFVKQMEEKGYVYQTSDGLYFDTSKDPEYGRLGSIKAKGLLSGARVEENLEKRNITDFAVWKFSPKDSKRDMEWESPWGKGFPGWHLECSVISHEYLGDTFDIHTGGIDHLTIHHPNEMAQTKAATGKQQARFWLHNNFLNFKDKKMAKSAGTFVRIVDIAAGGVQPLAYRYFMLQTHYRKELVYSWDAIKAAQQGLLNLYRDMSFLETIGATGSKEFDVAFDSTLADDLNTAKALDILQRLLKSKVSEQEKLHSLMRMDDVLGLGIREEWTRRRRLPHEALRILESRQIAREKKEWSVADAFRVKLDSLGVEVLDTPYGQRAALKE